MELKSTHWHRLWLSYKFIIQKSNTQINGGLIMFFRNSRIRFFKTSGLNCEQVKKKEHNLHSSIVKVL